MQAAPIQTPEARRTATAFEAAMWAMARPGLPQDMGTAGSLALAESLLDRECSFHAADAALAGPLVALGARPAPLEQAGFVFPRLGTSEDAQLPARLCLGSFADPDEGATLIGGAALDEGTALALHGPGIDGTLKIRVGGVDPAFWTARARAIRYPLGFEIWLVDNHRVLGLPRSTTVEVL